MEVGLIGGGRTAAAIARNLHTAGHQVTVFSPAHEQSGDFSTTGATIAERLGDACYADAVITLLPSDQRVEEIVLGQDGVAAAMPAAAIHICMSTIGIELSRRLSIVHAQRVQRYLAAPVFGLADAAAKGDLCIFVAGRPDTISRCQPLFEVVGRQTVEVGPEPAEANLLQLCAIGLVATLAVSLREAIALSDKGGIAPERFLKLMSGSVFPEGPRASYDGLIPVLRGETSGVNVRQACKTAAMLIDTANTLNVQLPLINLLRDKLDSLMSRGLGTLDWLAVAASSEIDDRIAPRAREGGGLAPGPLTPT